MTIRKLAKALGVTLRQLSPQQFDQGAASEIFSQESLVKPETANTSVSEAAASRFVDVESTVAYVRYAVEAVRTQSGLEAQNHLKHLTEQQQNVLLIAARNEAMPPSEVARQVGDDFSTVNRDLAILGEYGLVSSNKSGESRATPLGEGAANILSNGGLHYDTALEHVSTLKKAYESTFVSGDRIRRVDAWEAAVVFQLQDLVVQTIRDIVNVAEPAPDALTRMQVAAEVVHERILSTTDDHGRRRDLAIKADRASTLARKLGLEYIELSERDVDRDVVGLIPERVLRKHRAIPIRIDRMGHLVVAMSDPSNLYALENLRIISGYRITPVVATEDEIRNTQAKIFASEATRWHPGAKPHR